MNYYISDLHIGCINSWDNKTLEHDELLLKNWNAVVTQKDNVYILGDIGREGKRLDNDYLLSTLALLKGRKHLIRGNHDRLSDSRIAQQFVEITDYKLIKDTFNGRTYDVVLSHYPILMWEKQHKGAILLYGHTHSSLEDKIYINSLQNLNLYFERRRAEGEECPPAIAVNVGAMKSYMNWCPQPLNKLEVAFDVGLSGRVSTQS